MKKISAFIMGILSFGFCYGQNNYPFPITDLHVHCKGGFTIEDAVKKSKDESFSFQYFLVITEFFAVTLDDFIF